MGYALFANRKIYYTNLIFGLQTKLDNIMQQKQSLLNFSANIIDGKITVEEVASDPKNLNNYMQYCADAEAYLNTPDDEGGVSTSVGQISTIIQDGNYSEENLAAFAEMLNQSVNEDFAKQQSKKLEVLENQLDMQQKKIETQLSAAQQELQAVEQAEGKAIENATPKYSGVG